VTALDVKTVRSLYNRLKNYDCVDSQTVAVEADDLVIIPYDHRGHQELRVRDLKPEDVSCQQPIISLKSISLWFPLSLSVS